MFCNAHLLIVGRWVQASEKVVINKIKFIKNFHFEGLKCFKIENFKKCYTTENKRFL